MKKISLTILTLILLTSCATQTQIKKSDIHSGFPLRIALLADSQITTDKGSMDYGMRKKFADNINSVAIRPPALEYLAPLMLKAFLIKLEEENKREKIDLILYLGDGANSGCKDELDTVFKLLKESRSRSNIPSYYVIGNHDYLGAGNQNKMQFRDNLCNRDKLYYVNPAETKEAVMKRISEHNKQSDDIDKNFIYNEEKTNYPIIKQKKGFDNGNDNFNQIGYLSNKSTSKNEVEILLLDTSDYRDVTVRAELPVVIKDSLFGLEEISNGGFWGLKGSMTFDDENKISQLTKLKKQISPTSNYRLMVSHHSPKALNMFMPWNSIFSLSELKYALGDLLSKGENIWISGHTHTQQPEIETYDVGRWFSESSGEFQGINIGSTTDFKPHAVILEKYNNQNTAEQRIGNSSIQYKIIDYYNSIEEEKCNAIENLANSSDMVKSLDEICDTNDYKTILGLDDSYQRGCWDLNSNYTAIRNINVFSETVSKKLPIKEDEVKLCLAYKASKYEGPQDD